MVGYDPMLDPVNLGVSSVSIRPESFKGRSSKWPAVRRAHLETQPECQACGSKTGLEVHHIKPYHLFPELELDPTNLITLCECPSHNCHLIFGHVLRWDLANPFVCHDARKYRQRFNQVRTESMISKTAATEKGEDQSS